MVIDNFGSLQMTRTNELHFGNGKIGETANAPVNKTANKNSFENYLMEALNTVNTQQNDVSKIQEQLITDPDNVDVHDVTIAMSKARMSLNLAQTVIDRLVTGWNEITTTR